jgi:cell shape-determining protein MreC
MMAHQRQFVPSPNKGKRTILVIIAVVTVLFFAFKISRTIVKEAGSGVGMAVVHTSDTTSGLFSNIGTSFSSKSALVKENEDLKNQILSLQSKFLSYDALVVENKELKQSMGRVSNPTFILATILEKPSNSIYDTLIIDGGTSIGFVAGQMVYANGEIPIGKIEEVNIYSAIVRLFSSPKQSTPARLSILGGEKATYIDTMLVGRGGGNFQAVIPHDLEIPAGTLASITGLDGGVIAVYQKIISDVRDPLQTVLLTAPVNVQDLNFVQVKQD